jgi:hypothetical protein
MESDRGARSRGTQHSRRLLKVAALGGAVALLLSDDVRSHVLNVLFGAEEEFNYSSVTEPATPAHGGSPVEPWVGSAPSAASADLRPTVASDVADGGAASPPQADAPSARADANARAAATISPSPAAWRASAGDGGQDSADSIIRGPVTATQGDAASGPPAVPQGWWSPSSTRVDPLAS